MADITVKGFVNKGATKEGSKGKFAVFTLTEGIKQKDGSYQNFFYNVTDFTSELPPEDGSRVEIKGWLKPRYYGEQKKLSLDIQVSGQSGEVTLVAPPKAQAAGNEAGGEPDPWGN